MIEKNIVDRVPTHAGRIKLTPVEGKPDHFIMERADEPIQEGTPLNARNFNEMVAMIQSIDLDATVE